MDTLPVKVPDVGWGQSLCSAEVPRLMDALPVKVPDVGWGPLVETYNRFPGGASGKEPACQCGRCKRRGFDPWVWKIPEEGMATPSSILGWRIPWTD